MSPPPERVVLVTGAARGLGLAVARRRLAHGDRVHVAWRSSADRASLLEREFPGRVHRADLARDGDAQALLRAVVERDGRVDALVHAVGDYAEGPLERGSVADLARLFESNVLTAARTFDAARVALRAARGAALFFGTAGLDGLRARREAAAYAAAKSALLVLVRSWSQEEAPHGVRVNLLSPGIVPHEHAAPSTLDPARQARVPLGRAGTLDDVANAADFLLSDRAGHVTGADLPVAGGWLA